MSVSEAFRGVVDESVASMKLAPDTNGDPYLTLLEAVDGDTVDIVDDVRGRLRIRLLGIDTPETKKPGYTVGCWGPQARSLLHAQPVPGYGGSCSTAEMTWGAARLTPHAVGGAARRAQSF